MPFSRINKIVLLATIASLSTNLEKGSFSRHFIPSLFQILLVLSILLTLIYVLKERRAKEFFNSVSKKIWIAIGSFYLLVFIGWGIAIFSLGIPTTLTTILDFGTFTMGIVLFFLVSFYSKNDPKYSKWFLYALLIPNLHLLYYYATHGLVGYWGVTNDFSLDKVLDPNILSKTLLVPSMFFMSMALCAWNKGKQWWVTCSYMLLASIAVMMVFWTVSRGAAVSLVVGTAFTWLVFSFRDFTFKKAFTGAVIVAVILFIGYSINPHDTKKAFSVKTNDTFTLPAATNGHVSDVTVAEIQKLPQTESRLVIWHLYPSYILHHPFGVGPNSSHDFDFHDKDGAHIYYGPDSTYLIVALWGGLLGLVVYFYIGWSSFVVLWKKWQDNSTVMTLALSSILFTLSVALFFDGIMSLYWFYIVLALSLQRNEQ
jgi:hypothetical protein